jgi:hypothetical protein
MKAINSLKTQLIPVFAVLTAMILLVGLASSVWSAEQKSEAPPPQTNSVPATTNSAALKAAASDKKAPKRKHQLTGAELYSMHCNRCHPERYPTERTAAQGKPILLPMNLRVNLPPEQAKLILKYLQDNSGR